MPYGIVRWVDLTRGELAIKRRTRMYGATLTDVEPAARRVGARVHFDLRRKEGEERAIGVSLRSGGRTVVGAGRPESKHPLEVALTWGRLLAAGELDDVLALYAPDALLYLDGDALRGRRHIRACLEALSVAGRGRQPGVYGEDGTVVVRWEPMSVKEPATDARCVIEHGLITRQAIGAPGPQVTSAVLATATGEVTLTTMTTGDVPRAMVEYARQRMGHLAKLIEGPVLFARVKLTMAADPARARRAIAQASLDVNGQIVRAHVAAHDLHEAVDLLQRRLADKLEHRAERLDDRRRHRTGVPAAGEWRHGDLPALRPDYFDRPTDERRLIRHKAFAAYEETVDEAVFDMEQADYDFHLFRDLDSREDCVLERMAGGSYELQRLAGAPGPTPPSSTCPVAVKDLPVPVLSVDEAVALLDAGHERFVFFGDRRSGRGNVVYRRYDGHYGLITLEGPRLGTRAR